MQPKPSRTVWAVLFLLLCGGVGRAGAAETVTPFDSKAALAAVLTGPYAVRAPLSQGSVKELFRQARRIAYSADRNGDHWQTPQETDLRKAGDCEDKALWLYARLRSAGSVRVRLVVGRCRAGDTGLHMWLVETLESGEEWILDPTRQNRAWPAGGFGAEAYRAFYQYGR